ncbi:MAG TPA: cytochrome c oxidase subunit II [Polyangiaceae bacterium]|jgi:cytochrome c oxidase subunit 2
MIAGPGAPAFDPHSPQARVLATLFTQTLVVCGVIGLLVTALVLTCVVRFRASKRPAEPPQTHGHRGLEVTWTAIPLAIVIGLFALAARAMAAADPPADRDPDVVVVGHQWWWEARYASGAVTANEIHIPIGTPVLVRVESADVVHDFWVPQLGRKVDAVPGHPTSIWLQADDPGEYGGACAEYCGAQHAWMRTLVVAQPAAEFAAWEAHSRERAPEATTDLAAYGEQEFRTKTCSVCHAVAGQNAPSSTAPDLTHFASRTTIGAGVMRNDAASLARWLRDPQTIKPGSHMPDLNLTEDEVTDLTAYLETLR